MKLKFFKSTVLTSALALCFALTPVVAFAEDGTSGTSGSGDSSSSSTGDTSGSDSTGDTTGSDTSGGQTSDTGGKQFNQVAKEQRDLLRMQMQSAMHAEGGGKLKGTNLTRCDVRAAKINTLMDRVVIRGTRQTALFTTIATRVEKFYTDKNLSLSNYDTLVTAVNDAATKAQTDLSTLKDNSTFTCDSSNPKGQVSEFRTALKTEIQDLKALKTAVKDLIVGVKSVAGSTSSSTDTGTNTDTSTTGGSDQ